MTEKYDREFLELILKDIVAFFEKRDGFDERFIIQNLIEVIKDWENYVDIMEWHPRLEPSLVGFTVFLFGNGHKVQECLHHAEIRYQMEIEKGSVHPDWIREAIFKSIIFALENNVSFQKSFARLIIQPSINLKIRLQKMIKKVSLGNCVNQVLDEVQIFVGAEDVFAKKIAYT
jgi:hypothetical protein